MEIVIPKTFSLKDALLAQSERRTKMRWWDTKDKNMLDWSTAMQTAFNKKDSLLYKLMSDPIRYVQMHCLFIEDKNGKTYYEGDILEQGSYTPSGKKVSEPCLYVLIYSHKTKQTTLKPLQNVFYSSFDIEKSKIVGNIYENPELFS